MKTQGLNRACTQMCSLSVSMSWGSRTHNVYSEGAMAWTSFRNRSSSLAPPALLCTWSTAVLRLAARSPKAVPVPSPIPRSNAVAASRSWFNWSKNPAGSAAPTTGAPSTAGPTAGVAAADAPTAAADVPATGGDAVARPSPTAVPPAAVARPSPAAEMRSDGARTRVRAWGRAGRWVGGGSGGSLSKVRPIHITTQPCRRQHTRVAGADGWRDSCNASACCLVEPAHVGVVDETERNRLQRLIGFGLARRETGPITGPTSRWQHRCA